MVNLMPEKKRKHQKMFHKPSKTIVDPASPGTMAASMAKMLRGEAVPGRSRQPLPAGDYSRHPDLMESLNIVRRSSESFNLLPSKLRELFENDPARLNKFMLSEDKHDIERSIDLGLRLKPKEVPPPKTPEAPPPKKADPPPASKT